MAIVQQTTSGQLVLWPIHTLAKAESVRCFGPRSLQVVVGWPSDAQLVRALFQPETSEFDSPPSSGRASG